MLLTLADSSRAVAAARRVYRQAVGVTFVAGVIRHEMVMAAASGSSSTI